MERERSRQPEGESTCRFCLGPVSPALTARDVLAQGDERFAYSECDVCGSLQIDEIPEDLERYYGLDYYTRSQSLPTIRRGVSRRIARAVTRARLLPGRLSRALSGRRFARLDWFRLTGTRLDDPILEVGCGSGRLLTHVSRAGFDSLLGIDPTCRAPGCAAIGLRFERQSLAQVQGRFRLVMAHHSFEHMPEPRRSFARLAERLERGGHLLLRVPIADSWARRHFGADWVQLDAPRHLQIPTRRAIETLAKTAGLRLIRVEDDSGPFQIWGSEVLRKGRSFAAGSRAARRGLGIRARIGARWQARRLRRRGLGDQACFYLRRD